MKKSLRAALNRHRNIQVIVATCVIAGAAAILLIPDFLSRPLLSRGKGSAELFFTRIPETITVGQTFPLELRVKADKTAINAVESHISFNPRMLEIVSMTTEKSFCSFYASNSFDAFQGEVNIACGTPNPGFQGESVVVSLLMRAKAVGSSTIQVNQEDAQVLANDGKGTNILQDIPKVEIKISQTI